MRTLVARCLLLVVIGFVLLFSAGVVSAAEPAKRNVVLLIADDLCREIGCYGNARIKTPNLDALAAGGTRFSHGFATVASCSPSRAVMFTGLFTHTNGQYGLAHADHHQWTFANVQSVPKLLKNAGYRTAVISKLHVLPPEVYPLEEIRVDGRNGAEMARRAAQFISEGGDKPFFLIMGYTDPHRAGKGFGNEKLPKDMPEMKYDPKDVVVPYHLPDQPEVRQELAEYYQSVSRMDHGVGLMLKTLKDAKKDDSTLVIFVSDNGIPFPGAKTTLYDAGLHLPLIVSSPSQKKRGHTNQAMASWVDLAPTMLDWAGVKPPAAMPGRSLLPILDEENPKGWDVVYGSHVMHEITMYYPMRMVRTREHKYLLNLAHQLETPFASDIWGSRSWQGILQRKDKMLGQRSVEAFLRRPKEELYDLKSDPNELKNLAEDPKYADVLKDLRARMKKWQEETKDPWVVKYTHE